MDDFPSTSLDTRFNFDNYADDLDKDKDNEVNLIEMSLINRIKPLPAEESIHHDPSTTNHLHHLDDTNLSLTSTNDEDELLAEKQLASLPPSLTTLRSDNKSTTPIIKPEVARLQRIVRGARLRKWTHAFDGLVEQLIMLGQQCRHLRLQQNRVLMDILNGRRTGAEEGFRGTWLQPLCPLSLQLRQMISKWPRMEATYQNLSALAPPGVGGQLAPITQKPFYRLKLRNFGREIQGILATQITVFQAGVRIFSRVPMNLLTLTFLSELIETLSHINWCQSEFVRIFGAEFPNCPDEVRHVLTLNDFFDLIATTDAHYLTSVTVSRLAGLLNPLQKTPTMAANPHDSKTRRDQQQTAVVTSDYYSSSASSSVRTDASSDHPAVASSSKSSGVDVRNQQISVLLEKDMARVYTEFLEEKYNIFMSLLDKAALHSNLCLPNQTTPGGGGGSNTPGGSTSGAGVDSFGHLLPHVKTASGGVGGGGPSASLPPPRLRSVSFLDDRLKRQRRRFWREFVLDVWAKYQQDLINAWSFGGGHSGHSTTSNLDLFLMPNTDPAVVYKTNAKILESVLSAVPLPQNLTSSELGLTIGRLAYQWHQIHRKLIGLTARGLDTDGTLGRQLVPIDTKTVKNYSTLKSPATLRLLKQSYVWLIGSKSWQKLASGKWDHFLAVRYMNYELKSVLDDEKTMGMFESLNLMLDRGLFTKVKSQFHEAIEDSLQVSAKKHLHRESVESCGDYMIAAVLGPLSECLSQIPIPNQRLLVQEITVELFIGSLILYLITNRYTLSESGIEGLELIGDKLTQLSQGNACSAVKYLRDGTERLRNPMAIHLQDSSSGGGGGNTFSLRDLSGNNRVSPTTLFTDQSVGSRSNLPSFDKWNRLRPSSTRRGTRFLMSQTVGCIPNCFQRAGNSNN